ncbi:hypothetical protein [Nonomuraea dietziae]|uniref:hypothetical protein n=1 Tax=Nonomuraea dietziae TaxID=65515 RepID=UPI0031D8C367
MISPTHLATSSSPSSQSRESSVASILVSSSSMTKTGWKAAMSMRGTPLGTRRPSNSLSRANS